MSQCNAISVGSYQVNQAGTESRRRHFGYSDGKRASEPFLPVTSSLAAVGNGFVDSATHSPLGWPRRLMKVNCFVGRRYWNDGGDGIRCVSPALTSFYPYLMEYVHLHCLSNHEFIAEYPF